MRHRFAELRGALRHDPFGGTGDAELIFGDLNGNYATRYKKVDLPVREVYEGQYFAHPLELRFRFSDVV